MWLGGDKSSGRVRNGRARADITHNRQRDSILLWTLCCAGDVDFFPLDRVSLGLYLVDTLRPRYAALATLADQIESAAGNKSINRTVVNLAVETVLNARNRLPS